MSRLRIALAMAMAMALCLTAVPTHAAKLLWLTADLTPAARITLVTRMATEQGLTLQRLQYPLRGAPNLTSDERQTLATALASADLTWVDAPHPTVQVRLEGLLGATLARQPCTVWSLTEAHPVGPTTACPGAAQKEDRLSDLAAYLAYGGEANTRHGLALTQAVLQHQPAPDQPAPLRWPAQGLYHPDAPGLLANAAAFAQWQAEQPSLQGKPTVAVLVHRYHFVNGSIDWLDTWLRAFERQGLVAYAVFGQQLDVTALPALMEAPAGQLQARVIVTHQLLTPGAALQPLFERWGAPVLMTQPYRSGDAEAWLRDSEGLAVADVPFYLAQPEAAGAIDPVLVSAQRSDGSVELIARQADAVVAKARRLVRLQDTAPADKRLVLMVYNQPRGASNVGANFLNVPRSLEEVSQKLAEAGYRTERRSEADWISTLQPLLGAYYSGADLLALLRQDQAAALPLAQYEAWWATLPAVLRQRIEARWGPPSHSRFVVSWQGQRVFVIPRLQLGHLAVLPQPPRDETPHDQADALQQHRTGVPLSHHYLAVYLWARQADALLHFGTHGTLEWAEGKSRALDVLDDAQLPLGDVPVIYPFIADDLGEALTAKRRGRALMISHRTPAFSPAGFSPGMARLHDGLHEWRGNCCSANWWRSSPSGTWTATSAGRRPASAPTSAASWTCCTRTSTSSRRPRSRRAWPCSAVCPMRRNARPRCCRRCVSRCRPRWKSPQTCRFAPVPPRGPRKLGSGPSSPWARPKRCWWTAPRCPPPGRHAGSSRPCAAKTTTPR
jgi:cobaltochelatase CobN